MVRLRQLLDRARHRLLLRPLAFVLASIAVSQLMLAADRWIDDEPFPTILATTVDSGRSILSAIAGGLIASVTLLLSLMLVAVQLAASQFSPRSLRDWIGDRTQQNTIGVVLGTTVYCLLVLRETRTLGDDEALTPHLSVLLAMAGGVLSLVAVVRSVDHLTDSLRVGRVAGDIAAETISVVERNAELRTPADPELVPIGAPVEHDGFEPPAGAVAIPAPTSGWIQQIDEGALLDAIDEGSTAALAVTLGSFTLPRAPLLWLWPAPEGDALERRAERIQRAIAIGDTRTMQQDVGFGILQLVDIAVRALSPGVNDPGTANDIIAHLGVVMLALWERPPAPSRRTERGRSLIRRDPDHGDHLHAGFDQIRRYGCGDAEVAVTLVRTLSELHREVVRRDLPGPLPPIEEVIAQTVRAVDGSDLPDSDKLRVHEAVPVELRRLLV